MSACIKRRVDAAFDKVASLPLLGLGGISSREVPIRMNTKCHVFSQSQDNHLDYRSIRGKELDM